MQPAAYPAKTLLGYPFISGPATLRWGMAGLFIVVLYTMTTGAVKEGSSMGLNSPELIIIGGQQQKGATWKGERLPERSGQTDRKERDKQRTAKNERAVKIELTISRAIGASSLI